MSRLPFGPSPDPRPSLGSSQTPQGWTGSTWPGVPPGAPELNLPERRPDSLGEFEGTHQVERTDVDPAQLQEDLVRTLGQDVTVSMRMPTETTPGYLRVQDVNSGVDLDVDPALLDHLIAENSPPETNAERFLREFDAATEVESKLTAVRDYIARDVAEASHQAGAMRRIQKVLTRRTEQHVTTKQMVNPVTGAPITIQTL